jgi:hypothetical protein
VRLTAPCTLLASVSWRERVPGTTSIVLKRETSRDLHGLDFIVLPNTSPARSRTMSEEFPQGAGPPPPVTTEDVVSMARAAISASREESRRADDALSSGITVDLTHKNIARLPDEVIDIIKDEIERSVVAISLSSRSECGLICILKVTFYISLHSPSCFLP